MAEARLPDFKMCGTFDGESNAARWLTKLLYDFERAGHSHPPPAMYLRAIDMLFEGKAATWLDSNPRVRALVDLGIEATADTICELNDALKEEYPTAIIDTAEISAQMQMDTLTQGQDETLAAYYYRTTNILRRTHGKDCPCTLSSNVTPLSLSGLEEFTLGCIVNAFVKGIYDPHLRRKVMNHRGTTCRSLWSSYEIVLKTQKSIKEKQAIEEQIMERKKLARIEELCLKLTNRTTSSLLADLDDPTKDLSNIL